MFYTDPPKPVGKYYPIVHRYRDSVMKLILTGWHMVIQVDGKNTNRGISFYSGFMESELKKLLGNWHMGYVDCGYEGNDLYAELGISGKYEPL